MERIKELREAAQQKRKLVPTDDGEGTTRGVLDAAMITLEAAPLPGLQVVKRRRGVVMGFMSGQRA